MYKKSTFLTLTLSDMNSTRWGWWSETRVWLTLIWKFHHLAQLPSFNFPKQNSGMIETESTNPGFRPPAPPCSCLTLKGGTGSAAAAGSWTGSGAAASWSVASSRSGAKRRRESSGKDVAFYGRYPEIEDFSMPWVNLTCTNVMAFAHQLHMESAAIVPPFKDQLYTELDS